MFQKDDKRKGESRQHGQPCGGDEEGLDQMRHSGVMEKLR